jgi:hypothetical protein
MNKGIKTLFGLVGGLVFAANTYAAIVDHGNYLTDTSSGLDWLDGTVTFGKSYDYVSSQFGGSGAYAGWRYAAGDEFNALLAHFTGTPITGYGVINQETDRIDALVSMLGNFSPFSGVFYLAGYISDTGQIPSNQYLAGICNNDNPNATCMAGASGQDVSVTHLSEVPSSFSQWNIGSFLVRTSTNNVPEPTSTLLIGLGIVAMAFQRHKSKFRQLKT